MISTLKLWMHLSMLLATWAITSLAYGQANYLSVFGANRTSTTGTVSSCFPTNRFTCTAAPTSTSFYGEPTLFDGSALPNIFVNQNAVYSGSGQLLFSVDANGIYGCDANGTQVFSFEGSTPYFGAGSATTLTCGSSSYPGITSITSLSEMVCFPVPGQCNSYYVCYWATANGSTCGCGVPGKGAWLVAIQVTLTPSFGNASAGVASWYTCTLNFITQPVCSGSSFAEPDYPDGIGASNGFEIVADAPNSDGSRDLYTISPYGTIVNVGGSNAFSSLYSILSKWHISSTGVLPVNSPTTLSTGTLPIGFTTKAKIFNVSGDKVFAYISSFYPWDYGNVLATYDLNSGNIYYYDAPVASGGTAAQQTISGFEYLPGLFCFSYIDNNLGTGGLGYAIPLTSTSGSSVTFTGPIAGTNAENKSDMELDKNGDMLLGNSNSTLSYIARGNLSSSTFTSSSSITTLHYSSTACSGGGNIPLNNFATSNGLTSTSFWPPYLGTQIRGEDYSKWSSSAPQITDVDINTRCVPGALQTGAPQPTYTVTTTGGSGTYSYTWTPVTTFSGVSLNDVTLSSTTTNSPTVTSVNAPRLQANFWLTVTDADGCAAQRQVFTQFITSGYDLATRDSHYDMYDEPNTQRNYNGGPYDIFSGPDIWNRWFAGTSVTDNQTPEFINATTDNYLYVKVRNVGCISSPNFDHPSLFAYWTVGGIAGGESWQNDWNGTNTEPHTLSKPSGGLVGSTALTPIAPGGAAVFQYPWVPPNPADYSGTAAFFTDPLGGKTIYLCFASYIDDGHNSIGDPTWGLTLDPTSGNFATWCFDNNNMATLNTSDIAVSFFHSGARIISIANRDNIGKLSLQAINGFTLNPSAGASSLSQFATFKIYMGGLFDVWQAAGGHGTYLAINEDEKSVTFDGSHTMQLDSITIDTDSVYYMVIQATPIPGADLSKMQPEMFTVRTLDNTGALTGCSYNINVEGPSQNPAGVLAVTELSQGPSTSPGCEYAEMVVANCDSDWSSYVNVSGWIIDDNSGNFDTGGCSSTGITRGHYRLAYNTIWQSVAPGARIVVYNADNNCYNLPDTFTVDTVNNIYWVPVDSATGTDSSYVLQRYSGAENGADSTSYCSDTGATIYTSASAWEQTIALATQDAIQVRCPGCTSAYPGTPAFYHGLGYAPDTTCCFRSIAAGSASVGGPVEYDPTPHQKYVFTGGTAADLGNPAMWTAYNADAAGTPPATLGNVDTTLYNNIVNKALRLPCCGDGGGGKQTYSHSAPVVSNAAGIKVYPNPTNQMLNFDYPAVAGTTTIKLMDVTGRLMGEQTLTGSTHAVMNVSNYVPGIYIYQVITGGRMQSGKVVVAR